MTRRPFLITGVFTLTVFVSALLLFVIQPLAGELILPVLGGSSAVWTTVMLFFQLILLAGYIYAHGIAQYFSITTQVILHVLLMLLAFLFLPVDVPESILQTRESPALHLVAALMVGIGLPTFVVSSSAPLFQHWFGGLDHPLAEDPYYLYAASNAGSLIALLSYPFLIERFLTLSEQSTGWTAGFVFLTVLASGCGVAVFNTAQTTSRKKQSNATSSVPLTRKAWWVLITFIPSSLMLGVTHYLTMDIASVPLLWVVPLAAYLLSFILVFARLKHPLWLYRAVLPAAILIIFGLSFGNQLSLLPLIPLHIALFFLVALFFHGQLARDRPQVKHLTGYYICMALGGSLGGVFNALLAPMLFDRLFEYVLVMALALLLILRPLQRDESFPWYKTWAPYIPTVLAGIYFLRVISFSFHLTYTTLVLGILGLAVLLGLGTVLILHSRPAIPGSSVLLTLPLGVLLIYGFWSEKMMDNSITTRRSFYGQYEVYEHNNARLFRHGNIVHGKQQLTEDGKLDTSPTGYYHRIGPFGDLFKRYDVDRVAIAGLGIGGIAPYKEKGDTFLFFEIDPIVHRIAQSHFSYLDACGSGCRVRIGDARRELEKQPPGAFDLLIMDAYNSDSIPTHLLTREALELYLSRVKDDGLVALHISNRYFDLERIVNAIVSDVGAVARVKDFYPFLEELPHETESFKETIGIEEVFSDLTPFEDLKTEEANGVKMVLVAKNETVLEPISNESGWKKLDAEPLLWTDNYTNIVPLLF